ncbi:PA2169 family four-helix-bundle protein [Luteirhabdus pelagi]|uniref:PA2169 family four-helix-bundle protein n=1 Tax=Luteirhabdus pelagi TaxID=2792783 RepID=UPI0019395D57|nr:PA2169 family four-helix-bundle protein [Luteirhabdus pelagi]
MSKKYADFNKLNRLLVASFEAEKLYYNAAQDVNTTTLKRFLNYMATERNRMSHDISNELHSRGIEPLKEDAEKGNINRTWQEIKETLENLNEDVIINQCVNRDLNNVKRYDELIERRELPEAIITLLMKQRDKIEWYTKQAEQHKKSHFKIDSDTKKNEKPKNDENKGNDDDNMSGGKIRSLRAI